MEPIYLRIFKDIETKILSGDWRPGDRIPKEHDLVNDYGCSRMTVSKALTALVERGLVVRKRKTGSFVASPQIDRTVMDIQDIGTEATLAGYEHRYEILTRKVETLGPVEAAQLHGTTGAEILRIQCLHIVDGKPTAIERRIILLDTVPLARNESFVAVPPAKWLLLQVPWSKAKHVIRAVSADATTARILQIERGEPCLSLIRQTWQNDRMVTYVEITHPGDRFQFAGVFHPAEKRASRRQP
ncbi:transcriptional regulator, GntR family [Rhizobium tibeticum]|uniref:HTH-type transcriptional repressor YvoA n=1 Tax=Rhizobium tibeticum TaxID=501024 RepID=A0A1H8SFY4_9HYPH|nr:UTRA domain-containing protein [Rhizobium tibeticum]SEI12414.1 HTH-type transcriptional repressor YvoA [Rhizobium tibeticum]SEO77093.1 transcriptional regulator, GntR family [Rhizobium tibeticum]